MSDDVREIDGTFLQKVAIQLYTFMKMAGLKCSFRKNPKELLCFVFSVSDLTEDGTPIGFDFPLKPSVIEEVKDDPASIEEFCSVVALNTANQLFGTKIKMIMQHQPEESKIIKP